MLKQFRCDTCGSLLLYQEIVIGTLEIKCRTCGHQNVFVRDPQHTDTTVDN